MIESTHPVIDKIQLPLLSLRLGVFLVMLMWTLDKFINPGHSAAVFENFYGIAGAGPSLLSVLASLELILLALFVTGMFKKFSYGAVLLLHAVSTFSSYRQYLAPFDNLLFFAAWPMLSACFALFVLRDYDNMWTIATKPREIYKTE
jgi:putative oxidoreductase